MATPPDGHPYDGGPRSQGEHAQNRFNFPSAPSGQGGQGEQGGPAQQDGGRSGGGYGGYEPPPAPYQPPPQQPQQSQQQPQQPYEQPQEPSYEQPRRPRVQQGRPRRPRESAPRSTHNPLVRPYAMTGGRTRPRYQLAIEALVSTTADPSQLQGQLPEHQRICRLCFEIKSVAEISALLSIPLGVARILVADLAEAGLVAIHQPGGEESGGTPDVTLLERVLSGLRKL
ncbi:DUF742 domain-containing protein [Streptomyces paludis]|uniref:DUF742 domain-containing protein n=1 Tax=Streptomyces paludis TaxID=2282738 RepID=A0A345HUX6_9ACTN|nr:DUF742 domain-containing protein [Streptomyces paludis]AXG80500.1 DUF742 domain-containing protein [Streptomyces paludis]